MKPVFIAVLSLFFTLLFVPFGKGQQAERLIIMMGDDVTAYPLREQALDLKADMELLFNIGQIDILQPTGTEAIVDLESTLFYDNLDQGVQQLGSSVINKPGIPIIAFLFAPDLGPTPFALSKVLDYTDEFVKVLSNNYYDANLSELPSLITNPANIHIMDYAHGIVVSPIQDFDTGMVIKNKFPVWEVLIPTAIVAGIVTYVLLDDDDDETEPCKDDTNGPTFTNPGENLIVSCNITTQEIDNWLNNNGNAQADDPNEPITWAHNFSGEIPACNTPIVVTYTATDVCDNNNSTTVTFEVLDEEAPQFTTLAADMTVPCESGQALTDWLDSNGGAEATDNCQTITWENNYDGNPVSCNQSITVTFTVTDACGNSNPTTATFEVLDEEAPQFTTLAADMTVPCESGQALTDWLDSNGGAEATDNCQTITWENNYDGNPVSCNQSITVTFTVTDACGNSNPTTATFEVLDEEAPQFTTLAADMTVPCESGQALTDWLDSNGGAEATDNCQTITWENNYDGTPVSCNEQITVTFTVTDACGNSNPTTATFDVLDEEAPQFTTLAADMTVPCESGQALTDWLDSNGGAEATDNCQTITWENNYDGTPVSCNEQITVTFTVTDDCGNSNPTTATFEVLDEEAPQFTTPAQDMTVPCESGQALTDWLDSNGGAEATDNCQTITWENNYDGTPVSCNEQITVTFTVTDDCGNSNPTTATFAVSDVEPPTVVFVPVFEEILCMGGDPLPCIPPVTPAVFDDNCDLDLEVTFEETISFLDSIETLVTRFWTATDDCGNETVASQFISIILVQGPPGDEGLELTYDWSQPIFNDWNNITEFLPEEVEDIEHVPISMWSLKSSFSRPDPAFLNLGLNIPLGKQVQLQLTSGMQRSRFWNSYEQGASELILTGLADHFAHRAGFKFVPESIQPFFFNTGLKVHHFYLHQLLLASGNTAQHLPYSSNGWRVTEYFGLGLCLPFENGVKLETEGEVNSRGQLWWKLKLVVTFRSFFNNE